MGEEASTAVGSELGRETVELLQSLLRLDTTNPPGNEAPAAELLRDTLAGAGFECELLEATPGRPNLIARLAGETEGPTLCLLGHSDVVPADPSEWTHPPFAGALDDGMIWGRGAQDMKDQVAAEVAAAAHLGRQGWRPKRGELLIVITADEEAGATYGAKWLCEQHPDKVRADLVINEGGGGWFEVEGRRLYTLCVGEKGVFRFNLRTRGRAGHASVPALGENALLALTPLLERFNEQPAPTASDAGLAFIAAALGGGASDGADLDGALAELRARAPLAADYLGEPMLRVTMTPTRIHASPDKDNVIPSVAETLVDTRVPPGTGEAQVREEIERLLDPVGSPYEIEFVERIEGNASPAHSELADAIAAWVARNDRGAGIAPIVMPGFSDSHWWRKAFGAETVVYGFCPQRGMSMLESAPLVHAADERILVEDVELAATFYADIVTEILSAEQNPSTLGAKRDPGVS
jgi:acetylornithine deacetylase/succinyl-diaminopimelate desuccinylase-like protein